MKWNATRVLGVATEGGDLDSQAQLVPLLEGKVTRGGRVAAYVCHRGVCKFPTAEPDILARLVTVVGS